MCRLACNGTLAEHFPLVCSCLRGSSESVVLVLCSSAYDDITALCMFVSAHPSVDLETPLDLHVVPDSNYRVLGLECVSSHSELNEASFTLVEEASARCLVSSVVHFCLCRIFSLC